MTSRRLLLLTAMLSPLARPAHAQTWPDRPVKLVIPFPPGGAVDLTGRLLAERLGPILGQQIVVENRGGAGGNIAAEYVARAPADGYTVLLSGATGITANRYLYARLPFDPDRDFTPVGLVNTGTVMLVVNSASPHRSFAELMAFAKANPGKLSMGSSGTGTTSHLVIETVKKRAGIDITHVPYRGGGPAINDLIAGTIDMMFDVMPALVPQVTAGRFRPLLVGSQAPVAAMPDVPTMKDAGLDLDVLTWNGIFVPAATPAPVVARLFAALGQVVADPGFAARLVPLGYDPVASASPEAFADQIRQELPRWEELVRTSGARLE